MPGDKLLLLVKSVTYETPDIRVYELRARDGSDLPAFTAGAHVDLHLGNGLVRSYSIASDQDDRLRYRIGWPRTETAGADQATSMTPSRSAALSR